MVITNDSGLKHDLKLMDMLLEDELEAELASDDEKTNENNENSTLKAQVQAQQEQIEQLTRSVQKSNEYKQLTKNKLKEAAQKLKEYRTHVESLMAEVETFKKNQSVVKPTLVKPKQGIPVRSISTQTTSLSLRTSSIQTESIDLERKCQHVFKETRVIGTQTRPLACVSVSTQASLSMSETGTQTTATAYYSPVISRKLPREEQTKPFIPAIPSPLERFPLVEQKEQQMFDLISADIDKELENLSEEEEEKEEEKKKEKAQKKPKEEKEEKNPWKKIHDEIDEELNDVYHTKDKSKQRSLSISSFSSSSSDRQEQAIDSSVENKNTIEIDKVLDQEMESIFGSTGSSSDSNDNSSSSSSEDETESHRAEETKMIDNTSTTEQLNGKDSTSPSPLKKLKTEEIAIHIVSPPPAQPPPRPKAGAVQMDRIEKERLRNRFLTFASAVAYQKDLDQTLEGFTLRILGIFIRTASPYFISHPGHIKKLLRTLIRRVKDARVPLDVLVRSILRIFRTFSQQKDEFDKQDTPEIRSNKGKAMLSGLCVRVLRDVVHIIAREMEQIALMDILQVLKNFIFPEFSNSVQVEVMDTNGSIAKAFVSKEFNPHLFSKDIQFRTHVCMLYTRICLLVDRPQMCRILVYDILRTYPSICGLMYVDGISRVIGPQLFSSMDTQNLSSADRNFVKVIKASVQAIGIEAIDKNETCCEITAVILLNQIGISLQSEEQFLVEGKSKELVCEHVEVLINQIRLIIQESTIVEKAVAAKSIQLLSAVNGPCFLMNHFSVDKIRKIADHPSVDQWFIPIIHNITKGLVSIVGPTSTRWSKLSNKDQDILSSYVKEMGECCLEQLKGTLNDSKLPILMDCISILVEISFFSCTLSFQQKKYLVTVAKWLETSNMLLHYFDQLPVMFLRRLQYALAAM